MKKNDNQVMQKFLLTVGSYAFKGVGRVGLIIFMFLPLVVYSSFPLQACDLALRIALVSLVVSIIAGFFCLQTRFRRSAGIVLLICAFFFTIFEWVWSILIVGKTWGVGILFFSNLFFGLGTIVVAFAATLFTGQWKFFGELVIITAICAAIQYFGLSMINADKYS